MAVDVVFLFQQAHGVVGQVDQCAFFYFAALGRQAGTLLDDGVDRRTVHSLGVVGVAVLVIELEDGQPRRTVAGEIHDREVCAGDGGVGVHIIEQHPRDPAGQVDEIVVLLQLIFEG